eukprot:4457249-Amphidinium_carterae.1
MAATAWRLSRRVSTRLRVVVEVSVRCSTSFAMAMGLSGSLKSITSGSSGTTATFAGGAGGTILGIAGGVAGTRPGTEPYGPRRLSPRSLSGGGGGGGVNARLKPGVRFPGWLRLG